MINDANELIIQTQSGMDGFAALLMEGREIDELGFCFEKEEKSIQTEYRHTILSVSILDGVQYVPDYTFMDFESLEQCSIAEGIKTIGRSAFRDCVSLKECDLPDTVDEIGAEAFSGCSALQRFRIPTSVTELKYGTLCECENLRELIIPEKVKVIREDAISFSGMKRIVFMGMVEYIEGIYALPELVQYVFLQGPPIKNGEADSNSHDDGKIGLSKEATNCPIYYLNKNAELWAPNGETKWNGFPLVGIDSLADLPPLTETPFVIRCVNSESIHSDCGNINVGGRILDLGNTTAYFDCDSYDDAVSLRLIDNKSGDEKVLWHKESKDRISDNFNFTYRDGQFLFLDNTVNGLSRLLAIDEKTGAENTVYETQSYPAKFVVDEDAAYLQLYRKQVIRIDLITGRSETWYEASADELMDVIGCINHVLYLLCHDEQTKIVAVDSANETREIISGITATEVVPCSGCLVCFDSSWSEDQYGFVTIIEASTGVIKNSFYITDIRIEGYMNVTKDAIFLQSNYFDGCGPIYRIDWQGEHLELFDSAIYVSGMSLCHGEPANRLVWCDRTVSFSL